MLVASRPPKTRAPSLFQVPDMTSEPHIDGIKSKYLSKIVEELCAADKEKISEIEARDTTEKLKRLADAVLGTSSGSETKGLDDDGARDLVWLNVSGRKFQIPRKTIDKSKFLEAAAIACKENRQDEILLPDVDPDVFSDFIECLTHDLPCPCAWSAKMKAQCENYFSVTLGNRKSVTHGSMTLRVGLKCKANYENRGKYYPGIIAGINSSSRTCHVRFDDGDQDRTVPYAGIELVVVGSAENVKPSYGKRTENVIKLSHGVLEESLKILEDTKKYHSYTVQVQNDPVCSVPGEIDKKKLQDQLDSSIQKAAAISKSITDVLSRMNIHKEKKLNQITGSHLTVNARGEMIMFPASIIERSDFLRALFSVHSPETAPFVDFHPRILRHVFGAMSPKPLCSNKAHHIKKLNENIHFSRHLAGYLATDITFEIHDRNPDVGLLWSHVL